ncbi:hypothetical protein HGA64_00720 [Candidatus Falkowbacteria bacterium]|nr:hypothetical protein [Candidatus Falkowbacteria bacterium]
MNQNVISKQIVIVQPIELPSKVVTDGIIANRLTQTACKLMDMIKIPRHRCAIYYPKTEFCQDFALVTSAMLFCKIKAAPTLSSDIYGNRFDDEEAVLNLLSQAYQLHDGIILVSGVDPLFPGIFELKKLSQLLGTEISSFISVRSCIDDVGSRFVIYDCFK